MSFLRPPGRRAGKHRGRTIASCLAVALTFLPALAGSETAPAWAADQAACPGQWVPAQIADARQLSAVDVIDVDRAWAAGYTGGGRTGKAPLIMNWDGLAWTSYPVSPVGRDDSLLGLSMDPMGGGWAAGQSSTGLLRRPMLQRLDRGAWNPVSLPLSGSGGATLTDVASSAVGAWAVGHRWTSRGRLPLAVAWDGASWTRANPALRAGESGSILSVSAAGTDEAWAVGWSQLGNARRSLLLRWDGSSWQRVPLKVGGSGDVVFTDVSVATPDDAWIAGYRSDGSIFRPLAMHLSGGLWTKLPQLDGRSTVSVLRGVAPAGQGTAWFVGTRYDTDTRDYRALAARWDGTAWEVDPTIGEVAESADLLDVAGLVGDGGWVVGQAGHTALALRLCSGSGPNPAPQPPADPSDSGHLVSERAPTPLERGQRPAPFAARAAPIPGVRVVDVAMAAGIAESTRTYGAVVADFDDDRWPDIFLGRHSSGSRFYLNRDGAFVEVATPIGQRDRHGCTSGDLDSDGRLDLFCALGNERGQGMKANELWLQDEAGDLGDAAMSFGVADPFGRGREVASFDANGDGHLDLFIGNSADRVDGLPSGNRLFLNDRGTRFVAAVGAGLDPDIGVRCVSPGDIDLDGRTDLLVCPLPDQSPIPLGVRLYRNLGGGRFDDVTEARGITGLGEEDAGLPDLDQDGQLDLVQLSADRLRVSLQAGGRFETVYEIATSYGRAIAWGDVNGDGYPDLYVLRGNSTNPDDLLLVNAGDGRAYSSGQLPQATVGSGEDVVTIDHDRNGLDDFLVLNGKTSEGPVQLIAFFPA